MKRKTPREKKELDYDRQRRTHWDSDKAARKAIPAAKRAAHQIIRKRSAELIAMSSPDAEDLPTGAELAELEKRNRYRKYWGAGATGGAETLREHVKHQSASRKQGRLKRV